MLAVSLLGMNSCSSESLIGITCVPDLLTNYPSWITAAGADATAVNGPVGNQGAQLLIQNITDARNMLADMNIDIPVGNSDAGSFFNDEVMNAIDYGVRFFFASWKIQ